MAKKRTTTPSTPSGIKITEIPIPLAQPDRSDPSADTLISWAQELNLFANSAKPTSSKKSSEDEDGEYEPGRFAEAILWSLSLTMVHFTLDFLAQHQYAQDVVVRDLVWRCMQAFPIILPLFYLFHPHPTRLPGILPALFPISNLGPDAYTILFFVTSMAAGCYLIHITNMYSYYAVMKQAAPIGCLWIWSVVELSLVPAAVSLLCCVGWLVWGGYNFVKVA